MTSRIAVPWLIAILAGVAVSRAQEPGGRFVIEQAGSLFIRTATNGAMEKVADAAHYEKLDRDGGRVYLLLGYDERHVWLNVIQCDAGGAIGVTRKIADESLARITAIVSAAILPDGRLFIDTHVNPSLDVGVALDLKTGNAIFLTGAGFTWDSVGRHIAYLLNPPPGAPAGTPMELWLDGKKIRDVRASADADLAWNASGTLLTVRYPNADPAMPNVVVRIDEHASVASSN